MSKQKGGYDEGYDQGVTDEYNRIIGFLKWNKFCVVDNNGDYYTIEELEEQLFGVER